MRRGFSRNNAALLLFLIVLTFTLYYFASNTLFESEDSEEETLPGEDEFTGSPCNPRETQICGSTDTGLCKYGVQHCEEDGFFGACEGLVSPTEEICDGQDNDCDGVVDEDTVCGTEPYCGNFVCDEGEEPFTCGNDCPIELGTTKELWLIPHGVNFIYTTPTSEWDTTFANLDVFGFFGGVIDSAPEPQMQAGINVLQQGNKRVEVEVGGLRPFLCGGETYYEKNDKLIFDKLANYGVTDFIVSMDSPFSHTLYDSFHSQCYQLQDSGIDPQDVSPNCQYYGGACGSGGYGYTIDEATDELVLYMARLHKDYPHARIGLIEPMGLNDFDTYSSAPPIIENHPYPNLQEYIDVLLEKIEEHNSNTGDDLSLDFFNVDQSYSVVEGHISSSTPWSYDVWGKLLAMEDYFHSKGMRYGILMNDYAPEGASQEEKSETFHDGVLQYYDCYLQKGGDLDTIVVQSWVSGHPQYATPEEEDLTITNIAYDILTRINDPSYDLSTVECPEYRL